ncbi:alanine racemase C-terminal domain-containing protein [Glaciihabitans sp. INWT7]|uniref:alanine racemase C-terminal domain-containing protein n=1 Tax=Glaciihabitans sp. INWT7 TaxID=2596912 RepID=UPI002102FADB|nr:alanine racemase C-terminal domain-containing protein [Glaciihabitans sp. INWT7]
MREVMTLPGSRIHSASIDLSAIRDNAAVLARRAGSRVLVADVRADAYGHGLTAVTDAALDGGAFIRDLDFAASSGVHGDFVSAGVALYGLSSDPELRAAMRVSALVVGTKTIDAGESVSYGYTWTASARTNLALVGIGYADGLDRIASNVGSLLLEGAARRIVGRVAMNALVLDLGSDRAAIGDEAVVFGDPLAGEPAVWDWAGSLGRPSAEIVSVFGSHLPRVY